MQQAAGLRPCPPGAADDDAAARGGPGALHQQPGFLTGRGATHAHLLHRPGGAGPAAALLRRDAGVGSDGIPQGEALLWCATRAAGGSLDLGRVGGCGTMIASALSYLLRINIFIT